VERSIAHLKNWKILKTGYHRIMTDFPDVLRTVTGLEIFRARTLGLNDPPGQSVVGHSLTQLRSTAPNGSASLQVKRLCRSRRQGPMWMAATYRGAVLGAAPS
jgi:hypothetical protein